jgi:O-antigen/teichoic acid export membrane protein
MSRVVVKNAFILVGMELLSKAMDLAGAVVLARVLGVEVYGMLAFVYAVGMIVSLLSHFGFDQMVVRDVSRDQGLAGRYLADLGVIKAVLALISMGVLAVWVEGIAHLEGYEKALMYLNAAGMIAFTSTFFTAAFFRAYQRADIEAGVRLLSAGVTMAVTIFLAFVTKDLFWILTGRLFVCVVALVWSIGLIRKYLKPVAASTPPDYADHLRKAWPFALMMLFIVLYVSVDVSMVYMIRGKFEAGIYNSAIRIISIFMLVSQSISNAVLPSICAAFKDSKDIFFETIRNTYRYMVMAALLFSVGIILSSEQVLERSFGAAFIPAAGPLTLLALSLIPSFCNRLFNNVFMAAGRERWLVWIVGTSAFFNIVLNIVLIPRYGFMGAAFSALVTEVLVFALQYFLFRRNVLPGKGFLVQGLPVMSAALAVVCIGKCWFGSAALIILLPVSLLVMIGIMIVTGYLKAGELALLTTGVMNRVWRRV